MIRVLGIDPALRNFGFSLVEVNPSTSEIERVVSLSLSMTDNEKGKKEKRNASDLRRAVTHVNALRELTKLADVAIAEIPIGSQSARAMASYGVCIGILASCDIPLIQVSPTQVKIAATGIRTATKLEMIDWAMREFPHKDWLLRKYKGCYVAQEKNEHIADSLGAIVAGLKTDEWKNFCLNNK